MNIISKFGGLNSSDFFKGAIVAILGAILPIIQSVIETGSFQFDWKAIGGIALTAFIAYLTKNLLTNSEGVFLGKE